MNVEMIPVAAAADPAGLRGTTAVVFDVLRATSTIITALAAGYRCIYPVSGAGEAAALAAGRGYALAGERGGEKIPGFPLGNSPLEFLAGPGDGSDVLVLTTSNGTGAILRSVQAERVLIGAVLNAGAVASAAWREKRDIILVCAGSGGRFALEDALGAGFVAEELVKLASGSLVMDDMTMAVRDLALYYRARPLAGLDLGQHGRKLLTMGREEDLRWCAQLNKYSVVPFFARGCIKALQL